jgi:hypothetical protein
MLWVGVQERGCLNVLRGTMKKGFAAHIGTRSVLVTHTIQTSTGKQLHKMQAMLLSEFHQIKQRCR